jgi:GR25 family glycosyltransferase involved in LPS biosynthesis
MNPLEGLPPVYWVTLADSKDRHASMAEQFAEFGIKDAVKMEHDANNGFDGRARDYRNNPIVRGPYFGSMKSQEIAVSLGHIQMMAHWLSTSNSEYAVFLEDDVNLRNCYNWSFTWKEFVASLPSDWDAIQMCLIKAEEIPSICFRERVTADWSVTAYMLKRSYALRLLKDYVRTGYYQIDVPGDPNAIPIVENLMYFPGKTYLAPLFTEMNTFSTNFTVLGKKVKDYNADSCRDVTSWWLNNGKTTSLYQFMNTPVEAPAFPMIGTAVVKNTKWVKRLIESVDYPVNEIDAELDAIAATPHPFIQKIRVTHMPANIGVAASWNLMIKAYMKCPYWVIVNDDVAFGPGLLKEMHNETLKDPSLGTIHAYQGDHGIGSWDLFLIRDHVISEYGLFDENLYPAYNEDADYFLRFIHKPVRRMMNLKAEYYHGEGKKNEYHTHGSQTRKTDQALSTKLDRANELNIEYMTRKWGPGWRWCSPTETPFSDSNGVFPISTTTYDLRFVRQKHLGF